MPQKWSDIKPPGRPLPGDWKGVALEKSRTPDKVSHVAVWDGDTLLIVHNKSKETGGFKKPAGWGLPTETVRSEASHYEPCPGGHCDCGMPHDTSCAESPFEAAKRVFKEEVNLLGKEVTVNPEPILVVKTKNGIFHFLFEGSVESFTEIPKSILDPAGEVTEALFLDPENIEFPDVPKEMATPEDRMPRFNRNGKEEPMYISQIGFAVFSRFRG